MNVIPAYLGRGWVAVREGGLHPYRVTHTTTVSLDDTGAYATHTMASAHVVHFPTQAECIQWLAGSRPATSAPTLAGVIWATSEQDAIRQFMAGVKAAE